MEITSISSSNNHYIDEIDEESNGSTATACIRDASVDHHHYNYSQMSNNHVHAASEIIEIMEEDEELLLSSSSSSSSLHRRNMNHTGKSGRQLLTPISEGGIENNTTSLFSIDIYNNSGRSSDDVVYVAVGKSESSMDALVWTLKNFVHHGNTVVYLIHIFPDLKFIPSPFGGGVVLKSQVSPDLVESYLAEDTRKRRTLLTKYVDKCTSHLVQVETVLIESDSVANAILELISVLNIRHLVIGISKSNLRKLKAGKGSATVSDQIRQSIPEGCDLKIICQGKQLNMSEYCIADHHQLHSTSPASSPTAATAATTTTATATATATAATATGPRHQYDEKPTSNMSSCCFKF